MEHHFQDGTEPTILPHLSRCCTGPCQQGRVACPCPQSCEQALDRSILRLAGQAFLAIVLAGAVIAVGVAVS
jgi:hypothetical protein